ncbi:hypothetical protein K438DRAFT_1771799 [Mycena galopus ATCC 62051]|nr:hypothetical protein K438DRAFT_1771799 [Mycena galopus ATCC 62051]
MDHTDEAVALLGEAFVALVTKDLGEKESAQIITVVDTKEDAGVARETSFLVLAFDGLLHATVTFSVDLENRKGSDNKDQDRIKTHYTALNKVFDAGFVHGQRVRRDVAQAAIVGDANRIVTRRNGGNEEAARNITRRLRRRRRRLGDFVKEQSAGINGNIGGGSRHSERQRRWRRQKYRGKIWRRASGTGSGANEKEVAAATEIYSQKAMPVKIRRQENSRARQMGHAPILKDQDSQEGRVEATVALRTAKN